MGDFYQSGAVATLHNLNDRPLADLEQELVKFAASRPMSLVLPSLYSELQGEALESIVTQLANVPYIGEIVIGLDRASEAEFRHAIEFFARLPQQHRILWNDGPRLKALDQRLQEKGLSPQEPGKGRNAWFCLGYVLASGKGKAVALHDCDILTYDRSLPARLFYPVANPAFSYEFCKGYYARVTDTTINGRVSRLLVTPLIRSLKKIYPEIDYLDYLDCFRYPLAGEFSMQADVIRDLRIPSDWGLEIGILSEVYRNYSTNRLCQVDIADRYDHKHQSLSEHDDSGGLSKMSIDIAKAVFRKLAINGVVFSNECFRSLKATYYRTALDFVEMYYNDAVMNGLSLDIHREEQAVELFAGNIVKAGGVFLDNPMETPFIPSWNRVISAIPTILDDLKEAVEADSKEFSASV